tara:strand:- start:256 stop:1206 length:951 start_codon:yes stop_codon:yes gene_type:complete
MTNNLTISAIVPTIGNNNFIVSSLESLLKQNISFNEIIVFDNSQSDSFKGTIPTRILDRVSWFKTPERLPCYESWNQAIKCASSDYIFVIGDDDIVLPNLSQKCFERAAKSNISLLKGFTIDHLGNRTGNLPYPKDVEFISLSDFIEYRTSNKIATLFPGTLIEVKTFNELNGYVNSEVSGWAFTDEFFIIRALTNKYKVSIIEGFCWEYRIHPDQIPVNVDVKGFFIQLDKYINKTKDYGLFNNINLSNKKNYVRHVSGYLASCLGYSYGRKKDLIQMIIFLIELLKNNNKLPPFINIFYLFYRSIKSFFKVFFI